MADYKQSRCLSAGEREQVSFPGREPPPENRRGSSAGAPAPVGHRGERGPCYAQDEILLTAEHIFSSNDSYLLTLDKAICLGSQPGGFHLSNVPDGRTALGSWLPEKPLSNLLLVLFLFKYLSVNRRNGRLFSLP